MIKQIIIEIAVFTPSSALVAAKAGADRIELCSGYSEGGLSPSAGSILYVRKNTDITLHVMIRPRIGDFLYNEAEKEIILQDILFCRKNKVDGIVFGALKDDGTIDKTFTRRVVEAAKPMSVTFHRAFDLCTDLDAALKDLVDCNVDRVLTSGGKQNALDGAGTIANLVNSAENKIVILPGGGITPGNVSAFIKETGAKEIHFSARKIYYSPARKKTSVNLTTQNQTDDYQWYECDPEMVKKMVSLSGAM
jgi:copper homeostasis protein